MQHSRVFFFKKKVCIMEYSLTIESLEGKVSEAEWKTRCSLAAAFRVSYHYGWNETINNHISARISDGSEHFVMNPVGVGWDEITASTLIKANVDGDIISESRLKLAKAGKSFHSAILKQRPDLGCVFHMHPPAGVVISALASGLMYFDQNACALYGRLGRHKYEGLAESKSESERIIADLEGNVALLMDNHGLLTVGRDVGEAFALMQRLINACEIQTRILSTGAVNQPLSDNIAAFTADQMWKRRGNKPFGSRTWPAVVRLAERLDQSFRT
jgi:ribulose-5-phosphate 4-epimerase/fuculose-1-phosphate aldolase